MSVPRRALLTMLALAACRKRDHAPSAYPPDPVPPELWQQAEAGDAAQFELAEHLWPAHPSVTGFPRLRAHAESPLPESATADRLIAMVRRHREGEDWCVRANSRWNI